MGSRTRKISATPPTTNTLDEDQPATPDLLWKELIRNRFRDFVEFYKPDLFPEVVFQKTEFLDKELLSITGKMRKGLVDVLAKVHLKSGAVEFVLFHVEIQGYPEEAFPERMFRYFVRIWDKYRRPVCALAVITPGFGKRKAENVFAMESFGTRIRYEYALFDVRTQDYQSCIKSENPIQVAAGILTRGEGVPLWKRKYEVVRRLAKLGLTFEERNLLIGYVDRFSVLKGEAQDMYDKCVAGEDEKEVAMIMTSWEEKGYKRGRQEGIEHGIEKGIEKASLTVAEKMVAMGMSTSDIRKITGLPVGEIESLRKKKRR